MADVRIRHIIKANNGQKPIEVDFPTAAALIHGGIIKFKHRKRSSDHVGAIDTFTYVRMRDNDVTKTSSLKVSPDTTT